MLLIILFFALFPNHSIRLFHPVLWSTSASLPLLPAPLCMPILPPPLFVRVCAPKLTVKRANRKIITVKESTNGAFPRLTSIIITPRTAERRPGGRRTNGRVGGERTRSQRAAWQAGRRGAGVQVLVALRALREARPLFSSLVARSPPPPLPPFLDEVVSDNFGAIISFDIDGFNERRTIPPRPLLSHVRPPASLPRRLTSLQWFSCSCALAALSVATEE